jgi:hypothetical protein
VLSSSLFRTRSCSHNSTIIAGLTTTSRGALNRTTGRNRHDGKGANTGKQQRRVRTYPNGGNAQLGGRPSLFCESMVSCHHGGDSHHKDVGHGCHHQPPWAMVDGVISKDRGKKRQFLSKLADDRKRKVGGSTNRYLRHKRKPKRRLRTYARVNE